MQVYRCQSCMVQLGEVIEGKEVPVCPDHSIGIVEIVNVEEEDNGNTNS